VSSKRFAGFTWLGFSIAVMSNHKLVPYRSTYPKCVRSLCPRIEHSGSVCIFSQPDMSLEGSGRLHFLTWLKFSRLDVSQVD